MLFTSLNIVSFVSYLSTCFRLHSTCLWFVEKFQCGGLFIGYNLSFDCYISLKLLVTILLALNLKSHSQKKFFFTPFHEVSSFLELLVVNFVSEPHQLISRIESLRPPLKICLLLDRRGGRGLFHAKFGMWYVVHACVFCHDCVICQHLGHLFQVTFNLLVVSGKS